LEDIMTSRRVFIGILSLLLGAVLAPAVAQAGLIKDFPVIHHYDQQHLGQVAMPVGGIGTGTVSFGGRGDLRDWEIVNRPAKGFNPAHTFFAIRAKYPGGRPYMKALQGPVEPFRYTGAEGADTATNPGLPCFQECTFDAGYPFGRVDLSDPDMPVTVRVQAFNPLVPTDPDASGFPLAVLTFEVTNRVKADVTVTVVGSLQNFIGNDGTLALADKNENESRRTRTLQGIFLSSDGVPKDAETWGTMALTVPASESATFRTSWLPEHWGTSLLDFWDDLADDGKLENRTSEEKAPMASLAVQATLVPGGTKEFTFLLSWDFPNRKAWATKRIGNYYSTRFADAWDAAEKAAVQLDGLADDSLAFVRAFGESDLPAAVKEAALFNVSTLRTQTCFRTEDGRFFAWEGCGDKAGCCWGSCTHVWNYEPATAFLFGSLARSMRETEFGEGTDSTGLMSFRVKLPLDEKPWGKAAADGQMGCIMKMYRDWQLSGDDALLKRLWPKVRKALEFCWIPGGWDANKDGVMEGCQHNTMDVEYYGPNPQMGLWYLGALRAAEEMARRVGEGGFASTCHKLFLSGSSWLDQKLFNGRYYVQIVIPPLDPSTIAPSLLVGMGSTNWFNPDYQLANGCLVDQLVGQYMAHICGLGYLVKPANVRATLQSIMRYNFKSSLADHFNAMRTFALNDEPALVMAAYPDGRPANPFPYFTEVMTGFEYTAAVGMLYEGQEEAGVKCIAAVRSRYDGYKRNPFDEAECGHHYGRAMASWAANLALTGFHYSAVDKRLEFAPREGSFFWSNGWAYGTVRIQKDGDKYEVKLSSLKGDLAFKTFVLAGIGPSTSKADRIVKPGQPLTLTITPGMVGR
jgi:non-lysosomal glucosylceramidase